MPKSKVRKKTDYTINTASRTPVKVKAGASSTIYVSVMLGLMLLGAGLARRLLPRRHPPTAYGGEGQVLYWMAQLNSWNFLIGFSLMVAGLLMTMRWR